MIKMNKKADERLLSVYLFIIYIIVATGFVSGVILVYGSALDIRLEEARVLNEKIIGCISDNGNLRNEIFDSNFNLEIFCNLDLKDNTQKYEGEEQYGIKIEISDLNGNKINESFYGRKDFLEFCDVDGNKIPKCNEEQIYSIRTIDYSGEKKEQGVLLKIISAVGKVDKNAK